MEKDTSNGLYNFFFFNDVSLEALFKKNDTVFNTNKTVPYFFADEHRRGEECECVNVPTDSCSPTC